MDYIIEAVMDVDIGSIDLIDEQYDRAFSLLIEPDTQITTDIVDERYARAIEPLMDVDSLTFGITASKDNAFGVEAEILQYLGMSVDPKSALATPLHLELDQLPQLTIDPGADRLHSIDSDQDFEMGLSVEADRALETELEVADITLDLAYLMRDILNIPPSGTITVLDSISSPGAECPLDGSVIEAGVTTILQLEAEGIHLDSYLAEFFVYREPQDLIPILYRCSDRKLGGGIRVQGIAPVIDNKAYRQRMVAQIPLEPDDFLGLEKTRTFFYRCQLSQDGMGENYRIAKGKFTVNVE